MTVRRQYRRSFLTQVIARVDFDTPLEIKKNGPGKMVKAAIRDRFPVPETRTIVAEELVLGPGKSERNKSESVEYVYHGTEREKRLIISEPFMSVEYNQYSKYEDLREDFVEPLDAIFESFSSRNGVRLGLRYVNTIDIEGEDNPLEWDEYLEQPMLAALSLATDPSTISRAFQVLEFNYGESSMRLQFGMPNPDYPAAIRKKQFILDFDVHCRLLLDQKGIIEHLDEFHLRVNNSFEELIKDPLREMMGPISNEE
jgi:uncharacterized protein (TIGR04255 family)